MSFEIILADKTTTTKAKTEALCKWILANPKKMNDLIPFAKDAKDPIKATCIEAMEFATKTKPAIATIEWLNYVSETLTEKAPRVKWESAKVIGNIAHVFPTKLDAAITNLLTNTEHKGTVVRWSAAFALGEIIQLKTPQQKKLIPALESICETEEKNSIKKIYLTSIKKVKK